MKIIKTIVDFIYDPFEMITFAFRFVVMAKKKVFRGHRLDCFHIEKYTETT